MTPYLTTAHGVLFQANCLHILENLRPESVDTVFADPPFNIGKDYKNGFNDKINREEYFSWCKKWIFECARILKTGGSFFLYSTPELALRFGEYMREYLNFRHWIAVSMKSTFPRGKKLYPAHYAMLYFTRGEPKTFNKVRLPVSTCRHCGGEIKDYGGHRNKLNPEGLNLSDFWDDTSPNRHKKFKVRPGVNELKLVIPERAILISTNPGDIVFDPFGGGGSTYQAAEIHHRNWIGTELFDCAHIKTRLTESFPVSVRHEPQYNWRDLFNEDYCDEILRRSTRESLPSRPRRSISGASANHF
ncbi:DNA-methyltransferase [Trichlorobacter ammonificans]|uniref:DNA-methyltransferase n=1 Tax=Trichlorobacter ammonificans TaxID=2916410 RepID=UPI002737FEB7|nr:site-specific DNA-methyltransferase [Trichlorobacter ammonificans]